MLVGFASSENLINEISAWESTKNEDFSELLAINGMETKSWLSIIILKIFEDESLAFIDIGSFVVPPDDPEGPPGFPYVYSAH